MNGNGAQYSLAPDARHPHDPQPGDGDQYLQLNQSCSSPFSSINPEVNIELSGVKEPPPAHEWSERTVNSVSSPAFGGVTISPSSNTTISPTPGLVVGNNNNNHLNHHHHHIPPPHHHNNNSNNILTVQQTTGSESQMLKIRKVFIQRDYSLGTGVRFQNKFPVELEGLVDRAQFEHLIQKVNEIFEQAESLSGRTVLKNCMACMTAFLLYGCMESEYDRCMRRLRQFLEQQNALVWNPRGMTVTDPTERGLRVIEIHI